jgi:hypothetical protein
MAKEITAQWWWDKKEKTFTLEEVSELLELVKLFNAGAIDQYLTNHVDKVFDKWLVDKGFKKDA